MMLSELRPLSTGEILDTAFGLYRKHFAPLAIIVLAVSAVPAALTLYVQAAGGVLVRPGMWFFASILNAVLGAIGTAAAVFIVSDSYLQRPVTAWSALGRAVPFLLRLVVLPILLYLTIFFGFVFFVVPGMIFLAAFVVSTQVLVLEDLGPIEAMGRSWQLTRTFRWRMLALLLVMFIILAIPFMSSWIAAGMLAPSLEAMASPTDLPLASYFALAAGSLVQLLLYPLLYSVLTVAYYDLRVRKEGFDLDLLAQTLDAADRR